MTFAYISRKNFWGVNKPNYFSLAPLLQSAILYAGVFCESAKICHREKNMKNNDGIILWYVKTSANVSTHLCYFCAMFTSWQLL